MTFQPREPRRSWTLRLALLGVWALYIGWLAVTGRASSSELATMALLVAGVVAVFWLYDKWWDRPIPRPDGEDAAPPPGGDAPTGARREIDHGMSFDLLFPIALTVTLVATMAVLGFPGGGLGAGLVAIAGLALVGWFALRRAIGG